MKKRVSIILTIVLIFLIGGYYYATYPVINIHNVSFWISLVFIFGAFGLTTMFKRLLDYKGKVKIKEVPLISKCFLVLAVLCILVIVVGGLSGAQIFRAKTYANLLKVEEREFIEDIEESEKITNIALMDTASARIFGNRKIGSLSEVVSQYEVESDYNQINIKGQPMKVASLKYASFFKWWNNRDDRVPGYVQVNPVNSEAEYVELKEGMKYVPSGYFNDNLYRHVQLKYPTKIISDYYFEVDDEGNPYYICPTLTAKVGLFSGMDVSGAIICNPVDGSCEYYKAGEIPSWVDRVYDGDLLSQKYNWYGLLSNGFWNSIFGQKGCKQTTDDYGYKTIGDDVWVYTGVTSVTGDSSNVGFVMMNQRTSEARYYKVSGAEEHSAMESAEGAVQEKGYDASFPSLINVAGVPTYIMVLKDDSGLVKMYAMVNVEQYNLVATANTQTEVFSEYKKLLASEGDKSSTQIESETKEIVVQDIQFIQVEDGATVYIRDTEHNVYKQAFTDNEALIKIANGDRIKVTYEPMDDGIHYMTAYEFISFGESASDIQNSESTAYILDENDEASKEELEELMEE